MKILKENDAICPSQVRDFHLEIILKSRLKQKFPYLFFSSVIAAFWESDLLTVSMLLETSLFL